MISRILLFLWFPLNIVALVLTLYMFLDSQNKLPDFLSKTPKNHNSQENRQQYQHYASVPKVLGNQTVNTQIIQSEDITPELVREYLKAHDSPMVDSSLGFIQSARKYGIEPLFMLAVAQCESNLGKVMPFYTEQKPYACHNPFGWGIHSKGTLCFDTWEEGYETVAKGLKAKYFSQNLDTPEAIMEVYTPASLEKGGSWAKCVSQFLGELKEFRNNL